MARELLPLVHDTEWFFDTELLVLAERAGLRIHEVPVDWVDDPDSRVDILRTARDDLRGIARLGWALLRGRMPLAEVTARLGRTSRRGRSGGSQVAVFAVVGVLSTLAYAVLFLLLHGVMGPFWANATALVATAVANTAANRRLTFGVRGRSHAVRHQLRGLAVFGVGLAVTSGSPVAAARGRVVSREGHGDGGAHRRQPVRHGHAVRGDAGVGVPAHRCRQLSSPAASCIAVRASAATRWTTSAAGRSEVSAYACPAHKLTTSPSPTLRP